MCFNKESSLGTFVLSVLIMVTLYQRGYKWIPLFILSYSSIQFLEFLMWSDQECAGINQVASFVAYFVLLSQTLAVSGGGLLEQPNNDFLKTMFYLSIAFVIYSVVMYVPKNLCSKPGVNGHLRWKFIEGSPLVEHWIIFVLLLTLPLTQIKQVMARNLLIITMLGLVAYTFYNYSRFKTAGTMWCFSAILVSVEAYLLLK